MFGYTVSQLQDNMSVANGKITGTLNYISSGALANDWGPGYFMCLKLTNIPETLTSVKVGMSPSISSGLVEIINDPDKNGVFKVTDKDSQKFVMLMSDGTKTGREAFDLSGLTLVPQGEA